MIASGTLNAAAVKADDLLLGTEAQLLRAYATELWQLAYTLPDGVGEHAFLGLSSRMTAAADQLIAE